MTLEETIGSAVRNAVREGEEDVMAAKTTKRRKVWVNEYEHELGSIAWHVRREAAKKREDVTGTIAFVESRPGDVVLSRETSQKIEADLVNAHEAWLRGDDASTKASIDAALALLRGGR